MAVDHNSFGPAPQCQEKTSKDDTLGPKPQSQENVPIVDKTVATSIKELEFYLVQLDPKNIKEAMVDHAWIEAMQKELHQFE
ncbi:hypothetical protein Tco_0602197 [Tanacetum coccineum]